MPDSMHFDTKTIFYAQKITTLQVKNWKTHWKQQKTKNKTPQSFQKIQIDLSAHLHTTTDNIQKEFFKKQIPRFLKTINIDHRHNTKLYYRRYCSKEKFFSKGLSIDYL